MNGVDVYCVLTERGGSVNVGPRCAKCCVCPIVEWFMALNCLFGNREVPLVKMMDVEIFPKI